MRHGLAADVGAASLDLERARVLVETAQVHPDQVYREAALLAAQSAGRHPEVAALADRAAGLAAIERGELQHAAQHLVRSNVRARRLNDKGLEAENNLTRSTLAARLGDLRAAHRHAQRARDHIPARLRGRLHFQMAFIHYCQGALAESANEYAAAIRSFRRTGEHSRVAMALNNRAFIAVERGHLAVARTDLETAERTYRSSGDELAAARVHHNLGLVVAEQGDVTAGLRMLDAVEPVFTKAGLDLWHGRVDRCRLLARAGLLEEAWEVGVAAARMVARRGTRLEVADLEIALGLIALLTYRADEACKRLESARIELMAQDRATHVQYASSLLALARLMSGLAMKTEQHHDGLRGVGDVVLATVVNSLVGAGRIEAVGDLLSTLAVRRQSPFSELGEAVSLLLAGHPDDAERALRRCALSVERHAARVGPAARALGLPRLANAVAQLGLQLAGAAGDARRFFDWSERRSSAGRANVDGAERDAEDYRRALLLDQLRIISSRFVGADPAELIDLRRSRDRVESELRRLGTASPGRAAVRPKLSLGRLRKAVGTNTVLSYRVVAGELWLLEVTASRLQLTSLGAVESSRRAVSRVNALLDHAARAASPAEQLRPRVESACNTLETALLPPHLRMAGAGGQRRTRAVTIVPDHRLGNVPWPLLPALRGGVTTLCMRMEDWVVDDGYVPRRAVLAVGPGIIGGHAEVLDVARQYEHATVLRGSKARGRAVCAAMMGADIAHISAHGMFRGHNPELSSLQVADGPLTLAEVSMVQRLPPIIILSACELGKLADGDDDGMSGIAAALGSRSAKWLVAATGLIADAEIVAFMTQFHAELRRRGSVPAALAASQTDSVTRGEYTSSRFVAIQLPRFDLAR